MRKTRAMTLLIEGLFLLDFFLSFLSFSRPNLSLFPLSDSAPSDLESIEIDI